LTEIQLKQFQLYLMTFVFTTFVLIIGVEILLGGNSPALHEMDSQFDGSMSYRFMSNAIVRKFQHKCSMSDFVENRGVMGHCMGLWLCERIGWCIQKFPEWPPGARTENGTALCH